MSTKMRWASPPPPPPPPPADLQSSTSTSTLRQLKPLQDDDQQLIVIGGVKEDKAAAPEHTNRRSYWNPSAETSADSSLSSSSSHQQGGHWLEEDKIFPFKKRRILNMDNTTTILERELKNLGNARASRKCTKKIWADHVVNYKDDADADDDLERVGGANKIRILAENKNNSTSPTSSSQRCRRVNGHGWRCSQPSIVGYSMCEHHLAFYKSRVTKKKKKKEKKKIHCVGHRHDALIFRY